MQGSVKNKITNSRAVEKGNLHGSSGILQSLHPLLADDEDEGHLAMAQLTDVGEKLLSYRLRANEEAEILPLS